MKALLTLIAIATLGGSACAQSDPKVINDANAQPRQVSGFKAIDVNDGIDVYLTQGNEETVVVSANKDEYRNKMVTKVENGVLKIYYGEERGFSITWRDRRMRAYISVKNIESIDASGGSDIIVKGSLSANKLHMDLSGGSDFVGNVKAEELSIEISGGSDVKVSGTATNLRVNGSGGSDFIGYDLLAQYAIVDVSGGSDAQINVSKELYAEASGGSDINYKGSPSIKRSSSSGGGSVTKRN